MVSRCILMSRSLAFGVGHVLQLELDYLCHDITL